MLLSFLHPFLSRVCDWEDLQLLDLSHVSPLLWLEGSVVRAALPCLCELNVRNRRSLKGLF